MKVKNLSNNNLNTLKKVKAKDGQSVGKDKATDVKAGAKGIKTNVVKDSTKVDVSVKAQQMSKAKDIATPSKDIDHAKVARIQDMIDKGDYKVDTNAIADRLVENHLLFNE